MSKEEFEAIECLNNYFMDMACEYSKQNCIAFKKCFLLKELPFEEYKRQTEEFLFWQKSYCEYSKYYCKVFRQYHKLDK